MVCEHCGLEGLDETEPGCCRFCGLMWSCVVAGCPGQVSTDDVGLTAGMCYEHAHAAGLVA